ncbi:selenoprotein S-like [Branchiostoma lanceolatum]|uniref:selenoprotein S-like n=1 Tax=Branchiostoma lanceolatum TaxID=7740 RepID=UPI0034556EA5
MEEQQDRVIGGEGGQWVGDEAHPDLSQKDPTIVQDTYKIVRGLLTQYGWLVLFVIIVLMYLKSKLNPYLEQYRRKRENATNQASYNPEVALSRQEAMEQARLRMQEKQDALAAQYAEELRKREEAKRQEKIDEWEKLQKGKGYHSKTRGNQADSASGESKPKPQPKKRLRDGFNAMTGEGGGSSRWRPSPRGGARGGG